MGAESCEAGKFRTGKCKREVVGAGDLLRRSPAPTLKKLCTVLLECDKCNCHDNQPHSADYSAYNQKEFTD